MAVFQLKDPILTVGEVQALLRFESPYTITKLIKEGHLRAIPNHPSRSRAFHASEVQRYVDSLTEDDSDDLQMAA